MIIIKRIVFALIILAVCAVVLAYATGHSFLVTAFQRTYMQGTNTANINDYTAFDYHQIATANPQLLPNSDSYNQSALEAGFLAELNKFKSVAFLVIKDGEVQVEHYLNGYNDRSKTNSFSMAKTVTTMLIGIAIEEGYIENLEQAITDFLPEFKDDPLGQKATIGQLSLMNSGYEWTEHYYSMLSPTVELYYGPNVEDFLLSGSFSAEPGSFWEYSSASTELLGIVLKRALHAGGKNVTLAEYLSEKIWQPLQMNDDATWHTDDNGLELTYCCLNTNARNYAKLGMLMLNNGVWNNQQVVPSHYIQKMIQPLGQSYYGYSTWLGLDRDPAYYHFSGHLGQYIIVIPEHNMVVVRLGEQRNKEKKFREVQVPEYVQAALALTKN